MGEMKERFGGAVCSLIPPMVWHSLLKMDLVLPLYHIVSDVERPHVSRLYRYKGIAQFTKDLEYLLRMYVPVSLEDVICALRGERRFHKRSFLLSFDDGFREIKDVIAPILLARGVPAVFFPISSTIDNKALCHPQKKSILVFHLERKATPAQAKKMSEVLLAPADGHDGTAMRIKAISYEDGRKLDELAAIAGIDFDEYLKVQRPFLSAAQIRELVQDGFAIGAHSIDHPRFAEIPLDAQLFQMEESMRVTAETSGVHCRSFAFPYTDRGVSQEFFTKAFSGNGPEVTFGIGGMARHFHPWNLERTIMEMSDLPAEHIISLEYARTLTRKLSFERGRA